MIRAQGLSYSAGLRALAHSIDLEIRPGEVLAVLGPNGAGKTTVLRLLAGELPPSRGVVMLDGKPLPHYRAADLARRRAVLPQSESLRFGFLGHEVVALGRYPWGGGAAPSESSIVMEAMRAAGALEFAERRYTQLSGGERTRVQLARVFAQIWDPGDQGPRFLLLDEPTANLDLAHQHEVLGAVRRFASTGVGVVMVLHDLNLAQRYADRVLLLHEGRVHACGRPEEVLTTETIRRVFDVDVDFLPGGPSCPRWIAVRPRSHGATADAACS